MPLGLAIVSRVFTSLNESALFLCWCKSVHISWISGSWFLLSMLPKGPNLLVFFISISLATHYLFQVWTLSESMFLRTALEYIGYVHTSFTFLTTGNTAFDSLFVLDTICYCLSCVLVKAKFVPVDMHNLDVCFV